MKSKPEQPENNPLPPTDEAVDRLAQEIAKKHGRGVGEVSDHDRVEARLQLSVEGGRATDPSRPVISANATGQESPTDTSEIPAQGGKHRRNLNQPEENTLAEKEVESGIDQADSDQRQEPPNL